MIYREYGTTGKKVSAIAMGGMRFEDQSKTDQCVELILAGYEAGINYFDTAAKYGKSEELFGIAIQEMKRTRQEKPFYIATKSNQTKPADLRRDLETSLTRLNLDAIDFYHAWCIYSRDKYLQRKQNGIFDEMRKLKDEGLIKHICFSTHAPSDEIEFMLNDFPFDGVLLGYSVMNFKFRQEGLTAAKKLNKGVMVMNPLGGGIIPQHPDVFKFVKNSEQETVVQGALRFLLSDERITGALVGLSNKQQLQEAVQAVKEFTPHSTERVVEIKSQLSDAFDKMCTDCCYCDKCPHGIPIPKLMEAYNHFLLTKDPNVMFSRLDLHWDVELYNENCIVNCTKCGLCESLCTQSLDITTRLEHINELLKDYIKTRKK